MLQRTRTKSRYTSDDTVNLLICECSGDANAALQTTSSTWPWSTCLFLTDGACIDACSYIALASLLAPGLSLNCSHLVWRMLYITFGHWQFFMQNFKTTHSSLQYVLFVVTDLALFWIIVECWDVSKNSGALCYSYLGEAIVSFLCLIKIMSNCTLVSLKK